MLCPPGPTPHVMHGQGRSVTGLLTQDGSTYPIVSSAYTDRTQNVPFEYGKGARPMHRTTLTIAKPPWVAADAYRTTSNQYFGGSKSLNPVRRPPRCRSMHRSQWEITHKNEDHPDWHSHYKHTFYEKEIIPANRLHLTSLENRVDQNEGADLREVMKVEPHPPTYFSQYSRIHNKLGAVRGPGVPHYRPSRSSYNVITGEEIGPAWQADNKRISGNRVLYSNRLTSDPFS